MPLCINHCLTVVYEILDFALRGIFAEMPCPLQRVLFQFDVVAKIAAAEVRFQPAEQEAVAEIEMWTVWTLKDHRDAKNLHEIADYSVTVWSCIVP